MHVDRRTLISAGLGAAAVTTVAAAGPRAAAGAADGDGDARAQVAGLELAPDAERDQTLEMQAAIDTCAARGAPLVLPPGRFRVGHLELRPGSRIVGAHGRTTLEYSGGQAFITAREARDVALEAMVLDGGLLALDPALAGALVDWTDCSRMLVRDVTFERGLMSGLALRRCTGRVIDSTFTQMSQAGIVSIDAAGLEIAHNTVSDCGNNGIQAWRDGTGEDGTIIAGNRIERIEARAGGAGQNGNGINVFRAAGVLVTGNRIGDCAYSAIRANAASNVQMVANSVSRIGEVALYVEFDFEGALISGNLVDGAATGIAVTNFDRGGRLAVVTGNLVRNLARREAEPIDKRGDGISVEADAVVSSNVIENAASAGIVIGWGKYMRDVTVAQNLIRGARIGIMVTQDPDAGVCLISQNMISGASEGAVRAMSHGTPVGPDLGIEPVESRRIRISANVTA